MNQHKWYEYALNLLSRFPKTEKELRIKMYQKGYDSETVTVTLERLKKENYLNDALFAESYFNSEVIRKGKPLFLIRQKLEMKGIDPKILDQLSYELADEIQEGVEQGILKAIDAYKKKWVDGFEIIQKVMRKGYKLSDIKKVIKDHTTES